MSRDGPSTTAADRTGPSGTRFMSPRIARTALRAAASVVLWVGLYYLLPLDRSSEPVAVGMLTVGLGAFVTLTAFQIRAILRSPFPVLSAVEAMATSIPLFLVLFAGTYVVLATAAPGNFGGHLSHTDGLYFTVTVLSTVGFGDITPHSQTARLVVTAQMIADLAILGLVVRLTVSAVREGRARLDTGSAAKPGTAPRSEQRGTEKALVHRRPGGHGNRGKAVGTGPHRLHAGPADRPGPARHPRRGRR